MAIDPTIPLRGVQAAQDQSQNALLGLAQGIQGFKKQRRERNMLLDLQQDGADPEKILQKYGDFAGAQNYAKGRAEIDAKKADVLKTQADTQKLQDENARFKIGLASQLLGGVRDEAGWQQARQTAQGYGLDLTGAPEGYDPAWVEQYRGYALTAMDRLNQANKERELAGADATRAETARHNKASEGLTARGQDVSAATSRRGQDMADTRIRENSQRQRPMTEFQGKSAIYADRAAEAEAAMDKLSASGVQQPGLVKRAAEGIAGGVPFIGDGLSQAVGTLTNWTQSPEQQQVEQAQRNFVNAILRQESGAVISPAEFDNARRQYFPQPGDSKEVLAQKTQNRRTVIEGLRRNSGAVPEAPLAPAAQSDDFSALWGQ